MCPRRYSKSNLTNYSGQKKDQDDEKPRIRISVSGKTHKKRHREDEDDDFEDGDDDEDENMDSEESIAIPKKKKQRQSKKPVVEIVDPVSADDEESPFLDVEMWKAARKDLDGSFDVALALVASEGHWTLPKSIADDKFSDVAQSTLSNISKHDKYNLFSDPVTEEQAEGYSEIVKNPMDFGTMLQKVKAGEYGIGSSATAALYEDFLLVFQNCKLYNAEGGDVLEEASRILGYLPEAYASACAAVAKQQS